MAAVCEMVAGVRAMGLETCMTLGMLTPGQARAARRGRARLLQPQYRHLARILRRRSSPRARSRTGSTRLRTCARAGISVCCGGIVGMGETREDRVGFIHALATLPHHPESVPINALVPVKGTRARRHAGRHAAGQDRRHRVRPHRRGGADHHAAIDGPPVGRPRKHERGDPGAVLPGRRELDLHRRQAADHAPTPATTPTPRCSPSWG